MSSFDPGIPRISPCPPGWSRARIGDLVEIIERPVALLPDREYTLVVAKRARGGIVMRGKKLGREIRTNAQFEIRVGDFLISRRQIVHGACGVVPPELDGAIVSGEYTILRPNERLLVAFLDLLASTQYVQRTFYHSSVGVHVEKMVFRDHEWLRYPVNLPPVAEQQSIVQAVTECVEAVRCADRLVRLTSQRKAGLLEQFVAGARRFPGFTEPWQWTPFAALASRRREPYDPEGTGDPLPTVELEHVAEGTGALTGTPLTAHYRSLKSQFRRGDVLFGKLRPYLRKLLLSRADGVCSSEFWVLVPDTTRIQSEFLFYLVQSDRFARAANVSAGSKMPRAEWSSVAKTPFAVPSLAEQERIVGLLQLIDVEIDVLNRLRDRLRLEHRGVTEALLAGGRRIPA